VLYHFDLTNKAPSGNLCYDNEKLYGVTTPGNLHHGCFIFEYDRVNNTNTNVYDYFNNAPDGAQAYSGLLNVGNGELYGLASGGGAYNFGTLYYYDTPLHTYFPLYHFDSINGSGARGRLLKAANNLLYGFTELGGNANSGVLYSYNYLAHQFLKLFDFNIANGARPVYGGLAVYNNVLYGVTSQGGTTNVGVLFSFNLSTNAYNVLHHFNTITGEKPFAGLVLGNDNKLYGTTKYGGNYNRGVLFQYDINASTYNKIIDFDSINGQYPDKGLLATRNGAILGTSFNGGTHNEGVLYKYDIALNVFSKIYDFEFATKGAYPNGELIELPANAPNGISDYINAKEDLLLYPNPASNNLTIKQFGNESIKEIKIYNMLGEEILKQVQNDRVALVDVSGLPSGVYMVEVVSASINNRGGASLNNLGGASLNNRIYRKFVKQ
jgi:uncharacterized repeat protein (TIGR03803 family)